MTLRAGGLGSGLMAQGFWILRHFLGLSDLGVLGLKVLGLGFRATRLGGLGLPGTPFNHSQGSRLRHHLQPRDLNHEH